ncbi:MAG TPA: CinA family nicotinamide mononucleotide deamidase-related protein [Dehalococcoidia bacterium]|nr:CinA family nicotinamide mononucleotide deamidase-related protein [Dehalococcoidia bacterium]
MKAEIIPVGTEILLGNIVDTNSSFLANQLPLLGIDLYFISTAGDNQKRLVDTLRRAWKRADLIITTGGLGPTQDDVTREAISELVNEKLEVDERLWQEWQDLLHRYLGAIPQSNIRQATVIPSAQVVPNRMGTAPGWWVEKDDHIIIALPGPSDEMKMMWQEGILPKLRQRATGEVILSRVVKTFRLAEAKVDEMVASISKLSNPTLATYINPDGVYLRITAKAREKREAQRLIVQSEGQIRDMLSPYIWGVDDDTLGSIIGGLLRARNWSLATMESCTEGLLCSTIASGRESCTYFKGGLLAPCDEAKIAWGVDPAIMDGSGKESIQVAKAMADTARKNLRTDVGIGVGGSMNSDTNSGEAFVGLSSNAFEKTFVHRLRGNRSRMKQRAVYAALFDLRKMLLEEV